MNESIILFVRKGTVPGSFNAVPCFVILHGKLFDFNLTEIEGKKLTSPRWCDASSSK